MIFSDQATIDATNLRIGQQYIEENSEKQLPTTKNQELRIFRGVGYFFFFYLSLMCGGVICFVFKVVKME